MATNFCWEVLNSKESRLLLLLVALLYKHGGSYSWVPGVVDMAAVELKYYNYCLYDEKELSLLSAEQIPELLVQWCK